jgi:hypothetical protein
LCERQPGLDLEDQLSDLRRSLSAPEHDEACSKKTQRKGVAWIVAERRFSRSDRLFVSRKCKISDCKAAKGEPSGWVARAQAPGVRQKLKRFFFVPADRFNPAQMERSDTEWDATPNLPV